MRHSRSTDPMSVDEIREVILRVADRDARITRRHRDRVEELRKFKHDAHPDHRTFFCIHIFPLAPVRGTFDTAKIITERKFFPPMEDGHAVLPNFNGVGASVADRAQPRWIQVFRDGVVECVVQGAVHRTQQPNTPEQCHAGYLQQMLFRDVPLHLEGLSDNGFGPPWAILISISGVWGKTLMTGQSYEPALSHFATQDLLPLEPVIVELIVADRAWKDVYRAAFDQLWNAFAYTCWFEYR